MFQRFFLALAFLWPVLICSANSTIKVKVVLAHYADLYDEYEAVGECNSLISRDFIAAKGGVITEISRNQGEDVKAGSVILKLNGPLIEAQYKSVSSSFKRDLMLFNKGMISEDVLEKSRIQFESICSEYNEMIITAPFDGRIGVIKQHVGDTVIKGDYLFSITNGHAKEIVIFLPEKLLSKVKLDTKVNIYTVEGWIPSKVVAVSPYLIKSSGTFSVRIIQDKENSLLHGSFVKAKFFLNPHRAIVIPEKAVIKNDEGNFVFIVNNMNNTQRIYVTLGSRFNNQIEIVSGIQSGDKVVVEGLTKLTDDVNVEIIDAIMPKE